MPGKEFVQSVMRALDILECVSRGRFGCRLADVSEELQLNATTVYNLMRTLAERGYLCKDSSNRYRLGPAFRELAQNEVRSHIMNAARRELLHVAAEVPECIAGLAELCGSQIFEILRISPDRVRTVTEPLAFHLPVYTSCTGLCFLMQSGAAPVLLDNWPFDEYGRSTWQSMDRLEKFLRECRRRGFVRMELEGSRSVGLAEPVGENMALLIRVPCTDAEKAVALLRESAARIRGDEG